jgi:aldose 1-epimerase
MAAVTDLNGTIQLFNSTGRKLSRMTSEDQANLAQCTRDYPYTAKVDYDQTLGSTMIELTYADYEQPARSISVAIAPDLGSNMFRFRIGEHDLIYCEQELLKRKDFTGNFVLWPFPNRVRAKRYTYQGRSYSLEEVKKPQGNYVLVHGLVSERLWQYEQPVVGPESVSVTTSVEMTAGSPYYDAYPFASKLSLTYTLTKEGLRTIYRVQNNGTGNLPFGFALHPYFPRLSGDHDTLVSLPADEVMEANDELLPTGRVFALDKLMYAMYDLRKPVPIGNLNLDHVYTGLHKNESAVIDYRQQALQLHISASEDFTHIVFYAPPGMPFFCLEHQTCSTDAINWHNQDPERRKLAHLLEVPPGGISTGSINYAVVFQEP